MITAQEARELTHQSIELKIVLSSIEMLAKDGKCEACFTDLSHATKLMLFKLGYCVKSVSFSAGESNDTVGWHRADG